MLTGTVAAWLVVRARPDARFDETSLVGGLAGVTGGLVFVVLGWAAGGDLGTVRLTGLGPLLLPLLVMAVTTLGLAGMVTGLLLGFWRRFRRHRAGQDAEATRVLHRRPAPEPAIEETMVLPRSAGSAPSEDPRASG